MISMLSTNTTNSNNILTVLLKILQLTYRLNINNNNNQTITTATPSGTSTDATVVFETSLWQLHHIWSSTHTNTTTTTMRIQSCDVCTLLTLCMETLVCMSEMDVYILHQLTKHAKHQLLIHIGAMVQLASSQLLLLSTTTAHTNSSNNSMYESLLISSLTVLGYLYLPTTTTNTTTTTIPATTNANITVAIKDDWCADHGLATVNSGIYVYKNIMQYLSQLLLNISTNNR